VSSVGPFFSYVNDAWSHEPEAVPQCLCSAFERSEILIAVFMKTHSLWGVIHCSLEEYFPAFWRILVSSSSEGRIPVFMNC